MNCRSDCRNVQMPLLKGLEIFLQRDSGGKPDRVHCDGARIEGSRCDAGTNGDANTGCVGHERSPASSWPLAHVAIKAVPLKRRHSFLFLFFVSSVSILIYC